MKAEFSREAYHSYMILEPEGTNKGSFEEQMLVNQKSEYLLHFHPQETDGVRKYFYEITGMLDFVSCVNRKTVSCQALRGMIRSILGVCDAVNEYLLDPEGLLLMPDRIYMDVDGEQMHFAYLPGYQSDFLQGLQGLSECMLSAADHTDRECVLLVYEFYRILREPDFTAASIRKLLGDDFGEDAPQPQLPHKREEAVIYRQKETVPEPDREEGNRKKGKTGQVICYGLGGGICLAAALAYRFGWLSGTAEYLNIGEKYILAGILLCFGGGMFVVMRVLQYRRESTQRAEDPYCLQPEEDFWKEEDFPGGHYEFNDESEYDCDHTVVLTAGKGIRLCSMNKQIAADLAVCEFPSIIGAKAPEAQTVLACAGVSRKHALLEQEAGRYYLSDLDSTNGTWLNGERLRPDEKKVLVNEDLITFADVRFMFFSSGLSPDGKV